MRRDVLTALGARPHRNCSHKSYTVKELKCAPQSRKQMVDDLTAFWHLWEKRRMAGSTLSRETILRALANLSERLAQQGATGEICLFGGTVMILAFSARISTNAFRYYPPARVSVKTQYLIEGLFEEGKV
jgi:hypothetical protein